MAAIVTATPVAPEATNFGSTDNNQFGDTYVNDSGGLYILLAYFYDSIHLGTEILKSSDGGVTWISKATLTGVGSFYTASFYDLASRTIYFLNGTAALGFQIQQYNCATDSLGVATANTGAMLTSGGRISISYAGGNLFMFFSKSVQNIYYKMYSSGAWSADILVSNEGANNPAPLSTYVDSSNVTYLLFNSVGLLSGDVKIALVDSAGVVGTVTTIETITGANAFGTPNDGKLLAQGNALFAAYSTAVSAPHVAIGTPIGAPVWTVTVPDATFNPSTDIDNYVDLAIDGNGRINFFWIITVQPGALYTSQVVNLSTYSGTAWGATTLFYDYVNNPPSASLNPAAPASYAMQRVRAQWVNGAWSGATNLFLVSGSFGTVPTAFALPAPAAAVPLTNPGQGARKPIALPVNGFDFCLHREYRLYCSINVAMLTCGSIPACFSVDERDWGVDG